MPVFAHLEGICHVFVHGDADLAMARAIVKNAKLRRTGVCGAAETLLVDEACAQTHLAPLVTMLLDAGCAVRGDAPTCAVDPRVTPAKDADWDTEYLDAIIAVRVVAGLDGALDHIARHSSAHTESIITQDEAAAQRFLAEVDSAIVMHNASTQFADGGEFGFGRRDRHRHRAHAWRAARSASSSSPRSSIACAVTARRAREALRAQSPSNSALEM